MKKIGVFILLAAALTSCYDEYVKDYDYDGVYFPYQENVRTFVVGEGLKIDVGAVLAGVLENNKDRVVRYQIKNDLVTPDALARMKSGQNYIKNSVAGVNELLPMPADYYSLSNSEEMVIRKGSHGGIVTVYADSAKFLSDPTTLKAAYALPFYIESADADSIIEPMRYAVIGLKYENMLFGNYWHGGVRVVKDAVGNTLNTVAYYTQIPQPESKVWTLSTVAPFELETNGLADDADKGSMKLTLNSDGTITVGKSSSSDINVLPDGESRFNQAKLLQDRKIFLKYKYDNGDGTISYVTDTLTFRNRVRDGVNEWQDENPGNYE